MYYQKLEIKSKYEKHLKGNTKNANIIQINFKYMTEKGDNIIKNGSKLEKKIYRRWFKYLIDKLKECLCIYYWGKTFQKYSEIVSSMHRLEN